MSDELMTYHRRRARRCGARGGAGRRGAATPSGRRRCRRPRATPAATATRTRLLTHAERKRDAWPTHARQAWLS